MLKVGLTGGIGAGKSTVAAKLACLGAILIDADVLAREVVAPGSQGLREVVAQFGAGVLDGGGALNRPALGARVFGDDAARRTLEAIVHPRVRARTAELMARAPADAIVVNDVPLLVETGLAATYHLVIVVTATEATRIDRLIRHRGMSPADAYARIRAQTGEDRRRAAADVLLTNDAAVADLETAVEALWHHRLVPYEANLRAGRPAGRSGRSALVDPDPEWPAQAQRLAARVAAAAAGRTVRIDHVGPTSVPGMPSPDVIDIQVVVADRDAAARALDGCRLAGLVPLPFPDHGADPHGADRDGAAYQELVAVEADPGRPVTVTVRGVADPEWREVLLLRDWLRADPAGRDEYAALLRDHVRNTATDAAGRPATGGQWEEAALAHARAWAARSGWAP